MSYREHGILNFFMEGDLIKAKGSFSYNLGLPKKEATLGMDRVHGFTSKPQVAFIEGDITLDGQDDVKKILKLDDFTAMLELRNGKIITLREAWINSEGTVEVEEGTLNIRIESPYEGDETRK